MINEIIEKFREEYKKAYKGILLDEILANGNPWFENFIHQSAIDLYTREIAFVEGCKCEAPKGISREFAYGPDWYEGYNDAIKEVVEHLTLQRDGVKGKK
jgi:hypothetical protein